MHRNVSQVRDGIIIEQWAREQTRSRCLTEGKISHYHHHHHHHHHHHLIKTHAQLYNCQQIALLLQRGRAMLCVPQQNNNSCRVFYYSYLCIGFRLPLRNVVFSVTLRLLVINTLSSSPAINKLRCLPATSVVSLPRSVTAVYIARDEARRLADNRQFCLPHLQGGPRRNIAITFGIKN